MQTLRMKKAETFFVEISANYLYNIEEDYKG